MGFIKKLFNDDDKVVGLCSLKKKEQKIYSFQPKFNKTKLASKYNYSKNIFLR